MKLYHYSNKDLTVIDPDKFGSSHTPYSEVKRSYYYVNKEYREKFFLGSKYRYIIELEDSSYVSCLLYNLFIDPLLLSNKLTIDDIISYLKHNNYDGFSFINSSGHIIVCLFYPQKIINKEEL